VLVLAEEAYRRGARYVETVSVHAGMTKRRVDHSHEEYLSMVPGYREVRNRHFVEENWARIVINGQDDPDLFSSIDSGRFGAVHKAFARADFELNRAVLSDRIRWLVTALPTPGWAAKVFGGEADDDAAERLWEVLRPIMKLDEDDPIGAWKDWHEDVNRRVSVLRGLDLDTLRFRGPDTDLTVGLPPGAVWIGGGETSQDGLWFLPNIPTEEVFTTPDYRRTNGTVRLTRPALIAGRPVSGVSLVFKDGNVVEWGADEGRDTLSELFAADEGARRLGEVALVDADCAIYRSGLVFNNTLLDENAACHIAFGSAYPGGLPGGDDMSEEDLARAGANTSVIHNDVMVGSPEVDVTGRTRSGGTVPILTGGSWAI